MLKVQIEDGLTKVTTRRQLVVAPFDYDDSVFKELATDDVAVNFYPPKAGMRFVITILRARADRDVSPTADATVIIYEASSESSTTTDKVIHEENMVRGESFTINPMNFIVTEGKWVNAKTTDDDIHMTIMGYYVPV